MVVLVDLQKVEIHMTRESRQTPNPADSMERETFKNNYHQNCPFFMTCAEFEKEVPFSDEKHFCRCSWKDFFENSLCHRQKRNALTSPFRENLNKNREKTAGLMKEKFFHQLKFGIPAPNKHDDIVVSFQCCHRSSLINFRLLKAKLWALAGIPVD